MNDWNPNLEGIAIVGMAGRFPGARSVAEFWKNQLEGVETISEFLVEDLEVPNAADVSNDPSYVRARGVLDGADLFDPDFFAMHAREAELTDPQHRLFLESCWQALEDAGYDPGAYAGAIGVYAGCSPETYFYSRLCAKPGFIEEFTSGYQVANYIEMLANSRDFIATRVSYKLNLRGPSFTLQAGCSTSLLAVTQACQALLTYQCDMALAGGSSITFPQKRGSLYQDGGMVSPDGHCRAFDADAGGTVFSSGVAVVLLKRLDEAVRDGDQVYAVVRGFATNNDGAAKVGFTAPSVEGQARVIAMAQAAAGVTPEKIGYIEAHGTATALGDPIELAALAQAFRARTNRKRFCAIGTAKTNVGHLDVAAGVTGLIHAAQIIRNGVFPRTLHFRKPNPKFDFENSPFYVNTQLTPWKQDKGPRRAGVSSFGIGGTNAHVVLEQHPAQLSAPQVRPAELLVVSGRTERALDRATNRLAEYLEDHPELNFEDVAWTLQIGRRAFSHRRAVAARDTREAVASLREPSRKLVQSRASCEEAPRVCFLFPGQGSQFPNMGRELYETEPVFRDTVDRCAELLEDELATDLRQVLYPPEATADQKQTLTETRMAQPAIFTVEYALAQLWMSWDIHPQTMIGHSIGEFVAACLADVFSLEDALRLVAARGRMMQELLPGGMLSVRMSEEEVRARLNDHLSLAAINAPHLCVVAGPLEALGEFESELTSAGIPTRRLATSHAFHSAMMDPILEPFSARVAQVERHAPALPYLSGVTGAWITPEQAIDPGYWARHFRQPIQFSAGMKLLRETANTVLLEVGPGNVLTTLARQHAGLRDQVMVPSMPGGSSPEGEAVALLDALGALWTLGVQPNWPSLYHGTQRQRVSLPTYPFEGKRCWLEPPRESKPPAAASVAIDQHTNSSRVDGKEVTEQVNAPVAPAVPMRADRRTQISGLISATFEDLSGQDLSQADASTTFLEMGFDSLFLTQVTQALQKKFGLKITFRQLLGEQSTLNRLVEYMSAKLPDSFARSPAPQPQPVGATSANGTASAVPLPAATSPANLAVPATGNDGNASTSETPIERMMCEQIRTMNELFAKQLEILRNLRQGPPASSVDVSSERSSAAQTKTARIEPSPSPASSAGTEQTRELKGYTPFKPLESTSSNLTPRQSEYISSLIARYTRRTAGSKRRTHEYRQVLADPRVVSGFRAEWKEMVYPIVAVRSQGSHLWDIDGNEYVDILNGFGPIMLGHRPEFVEKAIEKQLHEGFEIGPQTALAGEVAQLISEFTGNERVTFCNTGSEAVIAAMRVARTVTARSKIVLFAGDYHGMFDEVLVKGFTKAGVPHAIPTAPGIPREKVANVVVLEYGSPQALEWIRANANELAAVLVEPVQSRHPALQPVAFLKEIREITQQSGTCLIFDEVVTGFRVHPGGCQALFGIRADLATYGKVLAGGMPIGVLAGKAQYMDALDGGMWQFGDDSYPSVGVTFFAGTFVRHPLTMAAAKAVLQYLKEQGSQLQGDLNKRTTALVARLNEILARYGVPTQIESFGSIFYFSFPAGFRFGSLFYYHLREKGVHVLEGFPCFLTTTHTDADLERVARAFEEGAQEMRAGGVLPGAEEEVPLVEAATSPGEFIAEAPMTEPQREIFLAASMGDEASCSFNESFSLHFRGPLKIDALRESIQHVVLRHDALRSTMDPDGTRLHFRRDLTLDIPLRDLTVLEKTAREGEFRRILDEDARRPFDLVNGPLLRAELVRFEPHDHILVFTSHHIVCDGWSTNILLDELCASYTVRCNGPAAELDSPVSFARYAQRQFESRTSPEQADTEAYWLGQFQDTPAPLDLPLDRPRQMMRTYRGATYRTHVGAETYSRAKQIGSKLGCTPFVTLLAAFATLLYRLSKQDDIVIGIPTAGQSLLENSNLVGHCVNFLPLRTRFRDDLPVSELLQSVGKTLLDAQDHQSYTYGTLVRKLAMERDPSRLPLIEVQFNLERIGGKLQFEGVEASVDPNPKRAVNFDIFFNVVESDCGLTIDCDYNTDLFDEATISRWMGHYEMLLEGLAANVRQPVSELPLLDDGERRQLLVEWNATAADYPRSKCVHQLIEEQVNRAPERVALRFRDEVLTYAELDGRASQLANYLGNLGVGPRNLVGIATERTSDMLIALLATWKTGAAYVPLDPTYPRERLASILDQTKASALLTHSHLRTQLPRFDGRLICLDEDKPVIARESRTTPKRTHDSSLTAYVIFTSGSTGKPKGVEVTHRSVVNLLCSMRAKPGFTENDRLLAITTLSFDIAALELFLPLICGGTVLLADRETAADGRLIQDEITRREPTVMQATPATWRLLLEAGWNGTPGMKTLCGGEALARTLADRLVECGEVWNMYGPTETTIWSATCRLGKGSGPVTFGEPIANTQFYVLDSRTNPVPVGVPGELYIGGEGVARGYFHQPDLTADRFLRDPFANQLAQGTSPRMFKTGDLVRYRPDGRLEFLGRLDHQVKVRGFRIELEEIEAALARHPAIQECVVAAREHEPGTSKLVAYFIASDSQDPSSGELRDWVAGSLPAYAVPSLFVPVGAFPKTPSGKIDRRALPAPDGNNGAASRSFVAPRTPAEKELARICAEVLDLEQVSIDDSLFHLGADSIHIFQIVARANRAGMAISPQHVLKFQTIQALALALNENGNGRAKSDLAEIPRVAREQYRLEPTSGSY